MAIPVLVLIAYIVTSHGSNAPSSALASATAAGGSKKGHEEYSSGGEASETDTGSSVDSDYDETKRLKR